MPAIRFKIQFITPLLIGGAKKDPCDEFSLGKALRGEWRFWLRAVCGGMLEGTTEQTVKALHLLEEAVFGSTSKATFKLLAEPLSNTKKEYPRCPHEVTAGKKAFRWGLKEETEFEIRILPRKGLEDKALEALKAVIWLWANLGSAGNRARRGFGSPFLLAKPGVFPDGLPVRDTVPFENRDALVSHLKNGISTAYVTIAAYVISVNSLLGLTISAIPINHLTDFFVVRDLSQIMVGNHALSKVSFTIDELEKHKTARTPYGAINQIHGNRNNNEIGRVSPRFASPVYVRLHKVTDGFIPVATWSKQIGISDTGTAHNTALDYIKNALKCSKDIKGNPL